MAWKEIVATSTANNFWINEGLPEVETKITPIRGFLINIPTVDGGVGTILNYDNYNTYTLRDGNYTSNIVYNINDYYNLTDVGDSVGLELKYVSSFNKIKFYYNGYTGAPNVNENTFNFLVSNDGINWTKDRSMLTSQATIEKFTDYGCITFSFNTNIITKFIAIRTTLSLLVGVSLLRVRELELYTPSQPFGNDKDIYQDYLTGKQYKKINGEWIKVYVPPEVPTVTIGASAIPPSAVGVPIGSFYVVRDY